MEQATGDEEYYCWCGTRLTYLPQMNAWNCSAHGLADHVYGPTPPLEDDRVAMMLGLVPDQRTPEERLLDAIRTNGATLRDD